MRKTTLMTQAVRKLRTFINSMHICSKFVAAPAFGQAVVPGGNAAQTGGEHELAAARDISPNFFTTSAVSGVLSIR